ncbi:MAG: putative lipid II flippase FtsW [Acutalibacteraceae bacterium]
MTAEGQKRRAKKTGLWSLIKQEGKMDLTFFLLVTGLVVTGLVMLFSASAPYASNYYGNSYYFITRQLVFAIGGFILMLVVSKINYHILKKFAWIITGISIALLILVLVMPATKEGFHRWLNLGFIQFQPSEIAKFAMIVLISALISANHKRMKNIKFQLMLLAIICMFCVLIIAENHLSATILVFTIGFVLMFIGGMSWKLIVGMGSLGVVGVIFAIVTGAISYASDRIKYWIDPWLDARGKGFQTIQSLLAIASGGALGRGIGQSNQKYLWLPEPQNDFIFAVVCEELGFVGAALIIIAFALLVWRGFVIALRAQDKFGMLLCIGLVFQVGLQTVLNILVVTNTIPNTGISLPFFSYGGTSLVMLLVQMGIVLSISRSANIEKA